MNVFISHNEADKECAQKVKTILGELEIQSFLSPFDMDWGGRIIESILEAVRRSTHLVLILSKDALKSPWIPFEAGCADALGIQILPFLTDSSLISTWPPFLRRVLFQTELEKVREHFLAEKEKPPFTYPTELQDPSRPVPMEKRRLTWQEVDRGIEILLECAREFNPKYIFGINRGGNIVGGMIAKKLGQHIVHNLDVNLDRPPRRRVIAYTCKIESGDGVLPLGEGLVCVESDPETLDIHKGKARIMLVDDGYYQGNHMVLASKYLTKAHKNIILNHTVLIETKHIYGIEQPKSIIDCSAYHAYGHDVRLPWDPLSWDTPGAMNK